MILGNQVPPSRPVLVVSAGKRLGICEHEKNSTGANSAAIGDSL
jgi:hypothetical protein